MPCAPRSSGATRATQRRSSRNITPNPAISSGSARYQRWRVVIDTESTAANAAIQVLCFVRRAAAFAHNLVFADAVHTDPVAAFQKVHDMRVPSCVERTPVRCAGRHVAPGLNHPCLARGALFRGCALPHDDAFAHGGIGIVQGRDRWVVRQAAGADVEDAPRVLGEMAAHRATQLHHPRHCRDRRRRRRVDKDRQHRHRLQAVEQQLQRLRDAMVHHHAARHRRVETRTDERARKAQCGLSIDSDTARERAVIADRLRLGADADGRHHVVEKPVEMVRREHDDQFGREITRMARHFRERATQVGIGLGWQRVQAQKRGMRQTENRTCAHDPASPLLAVGSPASASALATRRSHSCL